MKIRKRKNVRVALIGTSGIAKEHINVIKKNKNAELIFIFSKDYNRALSWSKKYKIEAVKSYKDLLSDKSIDCVFIVNEPSEHIDFALPALNAGKHILIEKPIDIDLERALDFSNKVNKSDQIVSVISQKRFDPRLISIKKIIDSGSLGKIISCDIELRWNRSAEYYNHGNKWRAKYGGVLINQAIHWLDIAIWFFGNPSKLYGLEKKVKPELGCSDTAIIGVEFANGPLVSFQCTTASRISTPETIKIMGTKGSYSFSNKTSIANKFFNRIKNLIFREKSPFQKQIDQFINCIINNKKPSVSVDDAIEALKLAKISQHKH